MAGRGSRLHPAWWTAILVAAIVAATALSGAAFTRSFRSYVPVTLVSDRAGLVMESGGKVKLRGVQVGRVRAIEAGREAVRLELEIDPDQIGHIPANVEAQIAATTTFGAKYVELLSPAMPSADRLSAGDTVRSRNVTVEVNTVFQNLVSVVRRIDPGKLNAVLSAIADGVRGQGEVIGAATTDANVVLAALNERSATVQRNWQALKGFSDTYGAAGRDILDMLDAVSVTSVTTTDHAAALDMLLLNLIGLSRSGIGLLEPTRENLVRAVNDLAPTTALLAKYNPSLTCVLVGGKTLLDSGYYDITGGSDGKSLIVDAAVLLGDDPYRYPDNLPVVRAKGGPGGKPGCGSLPDVAQNFPVRALVTDTGWGTGVDHRPNPGIGFPGWANYFPVTRPAPEPPSIRNHGAPAPGPVPYPGAPPYGAPLYGTDGTPLYPGVPAAPQPGAQPEYQQAEGEDP
ncbi:MCE family protein [Mycolicibacterium alvei]|uniref:Virulence factor n=1 Tax=Mycolicibacterium alvei TaxID=67081 RepID=A0A6N4UM83_9MYCO|nr:MCE family protein [Mycolicibacterium alvei]MCV7002148.1 MCE family protein [Mycolicibacterium alvei]BBX26236.1 virulence factor [Mycolicibacterium alvei]